MYSYGQLQSFFFFLIDKQLVHKQFIKDTGTSSKVMTTFVIPVPSGTVLQKEIESEAREKSLL